MGTIDVEKIAEVVLYEGYLLFPYRRSALKNQQRWTFGGVYPRGFSEATGGDDPWWMQTQCLVTGNAHTQVQIKIRFLHVADRKVARIAEGVLQFVDELKVGGLTHRPWEEAIEREILLSEGPAGSALRLVNLLADGRCFPINIPAGSEEEPLRNDTGEQVGALVREWRALQGSAEVKAERLEPHGDQEVQSRSGEETYRLTIRILNALPWPQEGEEPSRNDALRHSMISTHTILHVNAGEFISLLEPPDDYKNAADSCENIKTWPVLVGEPGERCTLLSSPIILYDYPQISPESQGNYFDATEIDELLALTVLTLTDEEKQEMRETDLHSREILERTESLSEEQLLKLHGAVRGMQPAGRQQS